MAQGDIPQFTDWCDKFFRNVPIAESVVNAIMRVKHLIFWIGYLSAACQAYKISCPEGWSGYSESTSCYLFMTGHDETFADAKKHCENLDANLVIIDSVPEKVIMIITIIMHNLNVRLIQFTKHML